MGQPGYPGQPGHILSGSSGSDPVHKISRSDPDSALDLIMEPVPDKSNELSILDDDDRSVSLIFFTICDWACENRAYLHKIHMFGK